MRHNNPNVKTDIPQHIEIHGEWTIMAAATVGAISSAESEAHAAKRKAFALLFVSNKK